ncbi:ATP synthase-coupling factor 6, mitochondrial [Drosophila willistoni]|uniref:ATP synthase-coupling factor 6, mitochondrial n=1 Tax=Drosophila willistoni TaxID=7260 RepID=UPI000C26D829|nr:ATP synthase-coupling factor 6, mitochondrial [Drosophila willistoni]
MLKSLQLLRLKLRRSISMSAPVMSKDEIHQLFLDKTREYRMRNPDGKPSEPTPEYEEELNKEFERLARHFGGGDDWQNEMIKFPKFVIPNVTIDPISLYDHKDLQKKEKKTKCDENLTEDKAAEQTEAEAEAEDEKKTKVDDKKKEPEGKKTKDDDKK